MVVSHHMKDTAAIPHSEVHFGGPDLPAFHLRDVLEARIAATPRGGSIDWVTYYLRDRRLAEELLRAHRRGVKVTVTLERSPRTAHANNKIINMLSGTNGLGSGFRALSLPRLPTPPGMVWKPHVHEKLYCFSHPNPVAFIGSFNPSGDGPDDDRSLLAEIGDQDRGHNVLVGLGEPWVVERLVEHARRMNKARFNTFFRFSPAANRAVKGNEAEIHFWPRVRPHPVVQLLSRLGPGARIRIAASHLKGAAVVKALVRIARAGSSVEILAEPTLRRVPLEVERALIQAEIQLRRVTYPEGLPMHNKFVLAEKDGRRWVIFGSFNWTTRSCWLNHEIGAISCNEGLFDTFEQRWEVLASLSNNR